MQTIQMHLSEKQKAFAQIYIKFRTFTKKDDPHSLCIFEIMDTERCG